MQEPLDSEPRRSPKRASRAALWVLTSSVFCALGGYWSFGRTAAGQSKVEASRPAVAARASVAPVVDLPTQESDGTECETCMVLHCEAESDRCRGDQACDAAAQAFAMCLGASARERSKLDACVRALHDAGAVGSEWAGCATRNCTAPCLR